MKVLVTGSAGFIGSALCLRLLARGDEVIGIDNDISKGAVEFLVPYFKSKVKMFEKNLYEITTKDFGKIDIILFFGVLYHLRYPFYALKVIKNLLKEDSILIIETAIYIDDNKKAFIYCPIGSESVFDKSCCTFFNVKAFFLFSFSFCC